MVFLLLWESWDFLNSFMLGDHPSLLHLLSFGVLLPLELQLLQVTFQASFQIQPSMVLPFLVDESHFELSQVPFLERFLFSQLNIIPYLKQVELAIMEVLVLVVALLDIQQEVNYLTTF